MAEIGEYYKTNNEGKKVYYSGLKQIGDIIKMKQWLITSRRVSFSKASKIILKIKSYEEKLNDK